jgi:phage terminase large subunit-like protein
MRDPAGNIKLDKSDKNAKIDGIVAGVMALAGLIDAQREAEIPEDWKPEFF